MLYVSASIFFDDAVKEYLIALKLNPNNADIYYNLGNIYLKQSKPDDAVREYKKALVINPDFADAHNKSRGCI